MIWKKITCQVHNDIGMCHAKLQTKYGVQAMNHNEIVISATLASLVSTAWCLVSLDLNDVTFIFFAWSRILFSWAYTAWKFATKH